MRPLDQVVRDRIAPVLREAGFKRRGRWFRRENDRGDAACVYVRAFRLGVHDAEFFVNRYVLPKIWWDFTSRDGSGGAFGLWSDRLMVPGMEPPRARNSSVNLPDHWSFDLSDQPAGHLLSDTLAGSLPEFLALLDPLVLLDYARTAPRVPGRKITVHQGMSVAALVASLGPSEELDRLLEELAQEPAGNLSHAIADFADFVPTWVANNRPSA